MSYDTYGLKIAQAFLQHLLRGDYPEWLLDMYLTACMHVLGIFSYKHSCYLSKRIPSICSALSNELERLEDQKPKISELVQCITLPPEIVAIITNSLRISKEVASLVRARRTSIIPTLNIVRGWSNMSGVFFRDRTYYDIPCSHKLTSSNDRYSLKNNVVPVRTHSGAQVTASLYDYQAYFYDRRCNVKQSMEILLDGFRECPLGEVCAWIVQLSSDLRSTEELEAVTEEQLREYLLVLIEECKKM